MYTVNVDSEYINISNEMFFRSFSSGTGHQYRVWPECKRSRSPADRDSQRPLERRAYVRFQIQEYAFAFIRVKTVAPIKIKGAGMGKIAAAVFRCNPVCLGRVTDVSLGGIAFQHIGKPELEPAKAYALDILVADCGLYLTNLPFRVISDIEADDDFLSDPLATRRLCVRFDNLSSKQFSGLEDLLQNCSCGLA